MNSFRITLPSLYCPIPAAIHPKAALLDERSAAWLARFPGIVDEAQCARLARADIGRLAARIAPCALDDQLQLWSDYLLWIFIYDDFVDEGVFRDRPAELAAATARLQRAAEEPNSSLHVQDPYIASLRDIRVRLDNYATPAQVGRWLGKLRSSLLTAVWKAGNIARGLTPSLDEALTLRLHDGFIMTFPPLLDVFDGFEVPTIDMADRRVRALTEMAAILAVWPSELVSYAKESHRAPDGHNIVDVIGHEYGCSMSNAITHAITIRDRILCQFLRIRESMLSTSAPEVRRYLIDLGHYIRGSLDWILDTPRYRYLNGINGQPVHHAAGCTETPSVDTSDPVPIPSISWWWQLTPPR
ncbi:hypothetical protein [Streptomyces sp. NBC_00847]|uniref:terpene synthase family protein n=1 Tax=unclassified Streptomyces TaxID=2593676 RepID=UPI0022549622|nr:hypothetical protein [Streptomyces sp. NBC_00847]MCX4881386.1 hypothetical protein [Streptomyces sp. NBC_00847]